MALFYPAWGEMSWSGNIERFAEVVDILQPGLTSSKQAKAASFPEHVERFLGSLNMCRRLGDFGVTPEDVPRLVERVAGDLSINPVPVNKLDVSNLLKRLLAT